MMQHVGQMPMKHNAKRAQRLSHVGLSYCGAKGLGNGWTTSNACAFSLSPVLRGEGWGWDERFDCEPRYFATRRPLTLPSPLCTGERVLNDTRRLMYSPNR